LNIKHLNFLSEDKLFSELEKCCGSSEWIINMISRRPFIDKNALHNISETVWNNLGERDFLEAFTHHPTIGDVDSLKRKFASTAKWAENEQQGANLASNKILQELKFANDKYLKHFGFIFIVCATGKTAEQMLALLKERLNNDHTAELQIAAEEQNKITHLRLDKLLELGTK